MSSSASKGQNEIDMRRHRSSLRLRFGVDFLDDALCGISPDDLILVGAKSGAGKSQLCCQIALANIALGKKVYYIALEAAPYEIESRLKYSLVMERYFADPNRPALGPMRFANWMRGDFLDSMAKYEQAAQEYFEKAYRDMTTVYKSDKFDVDNLIEHVIRASSFADLIIVDHLHYFDFDDDNENHAIKRIAKTARSLVLEQLKPIILVGHLRKPDRFEKALAPDYYEFHGSSELYKIATKIITMGSGGATGDGCFETFFRTPKFRFGGEVTRYIGRVIYSPKNGGYEDGYRLTGTDAERGGEFEEIAGNLVPSWARHITRKSLGGNPNAKGQPPPNAFKARPRNYSPGSSQD